MCLLLWPAANLIHSQTTASGNIPEAHFLCGSSQIIVTTTSEFSWTFSETKLWWNEFLGSLSCWKLQWHPSFNFHTNGFLLGFPDILRSSSYPPQATAFQCQRKQQFHFTAEQNSQTYVSYLWCFGCLGLEGGTWSPSIFILHLVQTACCHQILLQIFCSYLSVPDHLPHHKSRGSRW